VLKIDENSNKINLQKKTDFNFFITIGKGFLTFLLSIQDIGFEKVIYTYTIYGTFC